MVNDADDNSEDRSDTVSVFDGPSSSIQSFASEAIENRAVADWISERTKAGVPAHEIGVFVRSHAQSVCAPAAVTLAGVAFRMLDEQVETSSSHLLIGAMHLAKGLEFRAIVVMACDDEVVPLQERIETVGEDADLQAFYDTERQLLYVACTWANDNLSVTCV